MTQSIHIIVSGRVQGVSYRASTQKTAKKLQLDGWVKNLADGRVEICARGDAVSLEQLIAWCHKGPVFARVDNVNVQPIDAEGLATGFHIA